MRVPSFRLFGALLFLYLSNIAAWAQDPIATERPTQSVGSLVLPANSFQFEQGFMFANSQWTLDGFFRMAVGNIAEVRMLTYYDSQVPTIGAKVNILRDKDYRPGIALKADITGGQFTDYRVAIMQKITDKIGASFNFGGVANVGQNERFYAVLALSYSLSDRLSAYIEGYFEQNYSQFNAGITYLINSETQVDLNTGILDLNDVYIMVGIARRVKWKKEE